MTLCATKSWQLIMVLAVATGAIGASCDKEGRKNCDWVLEPEPDLKDKVDAGFIPVCARNRVTMKQDCRLQTTLPFAKSVFQKKFRYIDLRIKDFGIPRTITEITFCDGSKAKP